jgi:hypothetical protein
MMDSKGKMNVSVFVDGKIVPMQSITEWEWKRTAVVARFLQVNLNLPIRDITRDINGPRDIITVREEFTKIKINTGDDRLRSILNCTTTLYQEFCMCHGFAQAHGLWKKKLRLSIVTTVV